jgi:hypothetical protein
MVRRVSTSEREGATMGHPNEDLIRRGHDDHDDLFA